jgi:hypothetical protein
MTRIEQQRAERQARLDAIQQAAEKERLALQARQDELSDNELEHKRKLEELEFKADLGKQDPLKRAQTLHYLSLAEASRKGKGESDDAMNEYQTRRMLMDEAKAEQKVRDFILDVNPDEDNPVSYEDREVEAQMQNNNPKSPVVYVMEPPREEEQPVGFLGRNKMVEVPGEISAVVIPPAFKQIAPDATGTEILELATESGMSVEEFMQEFIRRHNESRK